MAIAPIAAAHPKKIPIGIGIDLGRAGAVMCGDK
jgi:hypothetical protein